MPHRRTRDSFSIGDLTIHVRGSNDPDAIGDVSYVIEHDTGTFFNPGDSRFTDEFHAIGSEFDIDLGSLAFGTHARIFYSNDWTSFTGEVNPHTESGKLYMDENDVIESANALQLDRLVPCHFDLWKGGLADSKSLHNHMASFDYPRVLEAVEIGDRLDVQETGIPNAESPRSLIRPVRLPITDREMLTGV